MYWTNLRRPFQSMDLESQDETLLEYNRNWPQMKQIRELINMYSLNLRFLIKYNHYLRNNNQTKKLYCKLYTSILNMNHYLKEKTQKFYNNSF